MLETTSGAQASTSKDNSRKNADGVLQIDHLREAAVELAWISILSSDIVNGLPIESIMTESSLRKEGGVSNLRSKLTKNCSLTESLRKALSNSNSQGLDESFIKKLADRPTFTEELKPEYHAEVGLCKRFLGILLEAGVSTESMFRRLVELEITNPRVRRTLLLLPEKLLLDGNIETKKRAPQTPSLNRGTITSKSTKDDSTLAGSRKELKVRKIDYQGLEEVNEEIDNLVGLRSAKHAFTAIQKKVEAQKQRERAGINADIVKGFNYVFYGNPGTGKTTFAKLVGKFLRSSGVLEKGHVIIASRKDMKKYVGATEDYFKEKVDEAMEGVLVLDDAHSMTTGGDNDFCKGALQVINQELEERRGNISVIIATYPDMIKEICKIERGLRDRFDHYIEFENYTPAELTLIYRNMVRQDEFNETEELLAAANLLFNILVMEAESGDQYAKEEFGNARLIRKVLEKSEEKYSFDIIDLTMANGGRDLSKDVLQSLKLTHLPFKEFAGIPLDSIDPSRLEWEFKTEEGKMQKFKRISLGQWFQNLSDNNALDAGGPVLTEASEAYILELLEAKKRGDLC